MTTPYVKLMRATFREGLAAWDRRQRDYDEMVRECYAQGYIPSHCIHGTYMWRDYDVICGACESGEPEYRTAYAVEYTRRWAASYFRESQMAAMSGLMQSSKPGDSDERTMMLVDALIALRDMHNTADLFGRSIRNGGK